MSLALALPRVRSAPRLIADLVEAERDRLVLWLPVFMGVGVLVYFSLRAEPPTWAGAAIAVPALGGAVLVRGAGRRVLAALAAFGLGLASAQFATMRAPPPERLPFGAVTLSGRVAAMVVLPDGQRVTIAGARLDGAPPLRRLVRVRLRDDDTTRFAAGDLVQVRALLRPPSPPAYPGGWDLQRDAYFGGFAGYGFAIGDSVRLEHRDPTGFAGWVQRARETIAARVEARLPGADGAIAATLLTGEPSAIPASDREAFRASGLAHLLAVAGLHIGAVMGLAYGFTRAGLALSERAALYWPVKEIAAAVALAAGLFYMVLTGAHVPIVRSFVMAALFTLAALAGRRPFSLRGLGVAATGLMLVAPQEVAGASFQLSFSAVLSLIAGYEALRPGLLRLYGDGSLHRRAAGHLVALALTSLLAGGASAPFGAYHFGRLQLYFVAANMLAVPITAFWVMPLGLLAVALMPLGLEGAALVPMGWGVHAVLLIARAVAAWPEAVVKVPHMTSWGLALVALGIAWLGIWRTGWLKLIWLVPLLPGLVSPWLVAPPDLLMAADGKLIGVRAPGGTVLTDHAASASRFVRDEWTRYWAAGPAEPLPRSGTAAAGAIACAPDACWLRLHPHAPTALLLRRAAPAGCAEAGVILSLEAARGLCTGPVLIDRITARRDGAVAVWLKPEGVRVRTDRTDRGDRPWVRLGRR